MLPIDRVRKISSQARERFDRARHRFGVKRSQLETKARTYDDAQQDAGQPAAPAEADDRDRRS
jgi:hypothetical protein